MAGVDGRVKSLFDLFYLVEYCPHTPPAQTLGELKRKVSKAKSQYRKRYIPRNVDTKCPSNIKRPEDKKSSRKRNVQFRTVKKKKGRKGKDRAGRLG